MSTEQDMKKVFFSPITGDPCSQATWYRHRLRLNETPSLAKEYPDENSHLHSQDYENSHLHSQDDMVLDYWIEKYYTLNQVFKKLFLAASSRGIPKKIAEECEKFL